MTKLFAITGKPISGEWGTDAEAGKGIPVLRTTNFTNTGKIDYSNVVMRNINKDDLTNKYLKKGDIILEKSGGSDKQPVGRVVYFDGPDDTYLFNNFTGLLRVKEQKEWLPKYVFWSLYASYKQGKTRQFENKTTGLHNLQSDAFVKKTDIKQVDFSKQIEISAILDKLRCQIETRKNEINKLDVLVKARFVEMFGDPVKNTKKFGLTKLSDLGLLERGKSKHRPRNDPALLGGPYPLIQTGEVTNSGVYIKDYSSTYSDLGLAQSHMWPKGTLCITIAANIAQTAILNFDACFPDSVVGFIPDDNSISTIYLHYWFTFFQKILDAQAPQVAQKNINLKILSNLKVIVPPLLLQQEFSSFVQQVDKSKVVVKKISKFHTISQEMCVND